MPDANADWLQRCTIGLQRAALDDQTWPAALELIRDTFGAAASAIETWDYSRKSDWAFTTAGVDPEGAAKIAALYPNSNPRLESNSNLQEDEVTYDYMHLDEKQLDASDYVRAMENYTGTRYFLAGAAIRTPSQFSTLTLLAERRQGHFTRAQQRKLKLLLPIVRLAVRTSLVLGEKRILNSLSMAEDSTTALALLDASGRVIYRSAALSAFSESVEGDELVLGIDGTPADVSSLIREALGGRIAARRCTDRAAAATYEVIAAPLGPQFETFLMLRAKAAVAVRRTDQRFSLDRSVVQALFELSDRELQVADALMRGLNLQHLSRRLGISPNTARVHLQSLFRKTHTHSQSELVSRLSSYRTL